MADPVTFTLGDDAQVYSLQFDFNKVCDAEQETGCNLMTALGGGGVSAGQTRALLYACLKTDHPAVELSEAGALLGRDMPMVLKALSTAVAASKEEAAAESE